MDASVFTDETFDAKKWINEIFRTINSEDNEEEFAENLIAQIDLHIQDVNNGLDECTHQMITDMPDIIKNIDILKEDMSKIHTEISSIKQELAQIQQNSSESIHSLEDISDIKAGLENIKDALHEADNWTVLASDIEEVFVSGNMDKVTEKLVSMQQSLNVFSNSDDYEDRRIQLEGYKNRLEAMVSPKIAHAFLNSDTDEASKIYEVFVSIERIPQLLRYYINCQKGYLFHRWKTLIDSDQDYLELVRVFYELMLDNWKIQMKWCATVFPSVQMTDRVEQLYADVLISLDPSVQYFVDLSLKQHNQPLLLLIQFYELASNFHRDLNVLCHSTNDSGNHNIYESESLMKSVYLPFVHYASKYGILERQLLDEQLWTQCLSMQAEDLMDSIQNVGQTVTIAMNIVKEAKTRCLQFAYGCSYPGLIMALRGCLLKYVERYKTIVNNLSQEMSRKEDWNLFHLCLSFQKIIGLLLNEIKNYDLSLVHSIASGNRQEMADRFIKCILTTDAETEYKELLAAVLNGSKVSVLDNVMNEVEKLFCDVHKIAYEIVFHPIFKHLENARPSLKNLNRDLNQDLPDYSYSPLEYITQIGEYLITLPQHLEPFLSQENAILIRTLSVTEPSEYGSLLSADNGGYANTFLSTIARGVCNSYCEHILSIRELSTLSCKQLAIDIDYLGNVLEELGVGLTETLQNIVFLLRISSDEYQTKCTSCPPKLVATIRQIRNIPPS